MSIAFTAVNSPGKFWRNLPFSRLENEISWIITEVCHFFSRLDCPAGQFQLFWALFELFFVNIEHFLMNSSMLLLIILLVFVSFGSSQIWWQLESMRSFCPNDVIGGLTALQSSTETITSAVNYWMARMVWHLKNIIILYLYSSISSYIQ